MARSRFCNEMIKSLLFKCRYDQQGLIFYTALGVSVTIFESIVRQSRKDIGNELLQ